MANRYDRDPDDYGFGRRDVRDRENDEQRQGQSFAQGARYGENRPNTRLNPWRDARTERDRNTGDRSDRYDQDYRASGRDNTWRENTWRDNNSWRDNDAPRENDRESTYYTSRENATGRDYYSSGRDYSGERGYFDRNDRGQDRFGQNERNRQERERPGYRGLYQESAWARDPNSGNIYGYEYSTRVDPRRFNSGDETSDRWRSENEQNRRFDIDRGWYTPGTSGYGNDTGRRNVQGPGQGHFGKGPKGYVRSDERIREDICDRLSDDDEIDARDITVTVKNAEVTLEGQVIDRRSKHRAEDVAESVSGVKEVSNHLRARKGFFQELGDKISGDDDAEHHGHRGSGTRNSTTGVAAVPQKTSH